MKAHNNSRYNDIDTFSEKNILFQKVCCCAIRITKSQVLEAFDL